MFGRVSLVLPELAAVRVESLYATIGELAMAFVEGWPGYTVQTQPPLVAIIEEWSRDLCRGMGSYSRTPL